MRTIKKRKVIGKIRKFDEAKLDARVNARLKENIAWLKSKNVSYENLLETAALFKSLFEEVQHVNQELSDGMNQDASRLNGLSKEVLEITVQVFQDGIKHQKVALAKEGADAAHKEHRKRHEDIRATWASGKYSSRDICAEQESAALGMSFSAARKALRNTPDPNLADASTG